jgi:hypothetical protein
MAYSSAAPVVLGKIHEDSGPTANVGFEAFKIPGTETSSTGGGKWFEVQPLTTTDGSSQLELIIPPTDEQYLDMRESYFVLQCKITNADGSALDNDPTKFDVYPVSNLPSALWDSVTVKLNGVDVEHCSMYGTARYLNALVDESSDSKAGRLSGEGWIDDEGTGQDVADVPDAVKTARKRLIAGSAPLSYFTCLYSGLGTSNRYLPPGVELRMTFRRAPAASYLMSDAVAADYKCSIEFFRLFARRVTANPALYRSHVARLVEGNQMHYPVVKDRTRSYTIPSGVSEHRVILGQGDTLPVRLLTALLPHEASIGNYKLSPYKFAPYNLSSVELTIDGTAIAPRIEMDFDRKIYAHAYAHNLVSLGLLRRNRGNGITYKDFGTNKTIFVWSLATDLPNKDTGLYFHLRRQGTVAMTLRFKTPTAKATTLLVSGQREALWGVNLEKRVTSTEGAA